MIDTERLRKRQRKKRVKKMIDGMNRRGFVSKILAGSAMVSGSTILRSSLVAESTNPTNGQGVDVVVDGIADVIAERPISQQLAFKELDVDTTAGLGIEEAYRLPLE